MSMNVKLFALPCLMNRDSPTSSRSISATFADGVFTFYCHSAREGHKLELLRRDPRVSFEMDCRGELQSADHACGYGYYYASVIGSGTAELIEGAEKLDALSALMRHMAGREDTFTEEQARGVAVLAIRVRSLSAKAKKH